VIKFVSDLRQVGDFLRVLRFPPPIKLTTEILLKVVFNTIKQANTHGKKILTRGRGNNKTTIAII
jgi:hypothetical protein